MGSPHLATIMGKLCGISYGKSHDCYCIYDFNSPFLFPTSQNVHPSAVIISKKEISACIYVHLERD